ncbi:MAG: UDP-N-acetylglucosamine 1-carboxyvinyltransferase [Thermoanaerobacterales bacterium 50_218]|nr:MAG: UDP-N-acetylglucosamine 1-carboxyvinyltransferase [Thermoanaerobacterales bacterium 50_218]HAA90411.1 UDP-N-acetylglucosamine 1-carboxyvinyltransferase [Peptococcaceae bacterium]
MGKIVVSGGKKLEGEVTISGAKNAILPVLAACLLSKRPLALERVPNLDDVFTMVRVLESLGVRVNWKAQVLEIDPSGVYTDEVPPSLMQKMRASSLVMGAMLGRFGKVRISSPGGCVIGSRPIDLHLKGFRAMGTAIRERHGFIEAEAKKLHGAEVHLDFPSVGATENIMMAAVMAQGTTIIRNAAREPEIIDLQNFLNKLGAKVKGAGLNIIRIDGMQAIGRDVAYQVIPDRIETGTFMVAAAITGGSLLIKNTIPEHVEAVVAKLREAGVKIEVESDRIFVRGTPMWKAVDIQTLPFPGFPTDMQPQMMSFLSLAQGTSVITENIFENRFRHVGELRKMGANIRTEGRTSIIRGVSQLSGSVVEASDLRAGAALVLAGLAAEGTTVIEGVYHIDRGYEDLVGKLRSLGADIGRV